MTTTMWRITRTEINGNESESHSYLSDYTSPDIDLPLRKLTSVQVGLDDVTLDEIVTYIESELEDGNYHSMTNLPQQIADAVTLAANNVVAKRVLWELRSKLIP